MAVPFLNPPFGCRAVPALALALFLPAGAGLAADQPQFGRAWSRNMTSDERGLPVSFDPQTGNHLKWVARLGSETHSTPVVAGGRVYIGTNNQEPRDPKHQGDRGVLMCLDESTGGLLWQLVVPKREEDTYFDWPHSGLCSPPSVESNRVYVVDNRGEVLCLDALGLTNGNDGPYLDEGAHMTRHPPGEDPAKPVPDLVPGPLDADILWLFNLTTGAGIWSHDAAHSSVLIDGDLLYLNSGTGVDNTHKRIRTPDAPALVVLEKRTGRFVARENERIAPNIFHNTWSPPSLGTINGKRLVFLAAGNGIVYAFEALRALPSGPQPATLKKAWQFDFDPTAPKANVHKFNSNRQESPSNFYGMPVVDGNRVYVAGGGDIWWGKNEAWLKCIDATGAGDITTNGLVWSYPLQKHVLSTPAVWQGLVFIADCGRTFHCVDAATGKACWTHEIQGEVWASPLVADGKVYLGTRGGVFYTFAASREKQVLSAIELGTPISGTAVAANGVLFLATMTHLYALQQ